MNTIGSNNISNLLKFKLDLLGGVFRTSTKLDKHVQSLLMAILLNEPSGTLIKEENTAEEDQSWKTLEGERETPLYTGILSAVQWRVPLGS